MRKPAGVIVAAVILGILSLLGILISLLILGVCLFVHSPVIPNIPAVRVSLIAISGSMVTFFVFCACTAAGLLRMRRWARWSILVIGGVEFLLCSLLCAGTLLARSSVPKLPTGPAAVNLQAILITLAGLYALLSLLGGWWLVYFSLRPVRLAFHGSAAPAAMPPAVPAAGIIDSPAAHHQGT